MGCSGCGKRRAQFKRVVEAEIKKKEIPKSPRQQRIENRRKRIEARKKRIEIRNSRKASKLS